MNIHLSQCPVLLLPSLCNWQTITMFSIIFKATIQKFLMLL